MIKKLVVSDNMHRYYYWLKQLYLSTSDYKYINCVDDIDGIDEAEIYFLGDYWLNPIYGEFKFNILKNNSKLIYE